MEKSRQLIFVCTGSDCKKAGAKKLLKELKEALNAPDRKGKYKLIKTKCLDRCKTAPNVIIKENFYKKASLSSILDQIKMP